MVSRIQKITVEISGDITKLQNALKGVNGQIKSTQSQLNDLKSLETQTNQSATAVQKIASFGKKLKMVGNNISSARQKLLLVTGTVVGLGTAVVIKVANFESAMSQV